MTRSRASIAVVVLLIGLLFALDVYATYVVFTSKYPGANDFYPRWRGAQVYWQEGVDPYSSQATLAIQQDMYGRPAWPDEDQVLFAYPFYTVLLMAPFVWLPYTWAQAVWMALVEFSLIGGVVLCLNIVGWRVSHWLLGLTVLWSVLFYHSTRTIVLGQFAGLVFLWIAVVLWALGRRYDVIAGALLALTTVKPQMSVLLIPALLLWGLGQRRWRFLGGFGAAMALLVGVSFALLPGWIGRFIRQIALYPSYTALGSPVWIVTHYYLPQLGKPVEIGLSALLLFCLLAQWRHLPRAGVTLGTFHWIVGLTLIVTNLIVTRTATTNYVVLYIPLFLGLKAAANRLSRSDWLLAFFCLLSTVGMWTLFLTTVVGKFEHPAVYLPLPFGLLAAFGWGRTALQRMTVRQAVR
jgi:hypothetical protein